MPHPPTNTGIVPPPEILVNSVVCTLPIYKSKSFLHQKYVVEGLSIKEISELTFSSRSAITNALKEYGYSIEKVTKAKRIKVPVYGTKIIKRNKENHLREQRVIDSILEMHKSGNGPCAIARILNQMKVPTKAQGKKWYSETVRNILKRNL